MAEFRYEGLRRAPDVEAENLFAFDTTDRLLAERALALKIPGGRIAVIGDGYGAITLRLLAERLRGIRVHQDLVTGRRALAANAEELGLGGYEPCGLDEALLSGALLVLLQLPKSLAELEEIAEAVARWADPDVVVVAGGRVKHMTLAQNEILARSFAEVHAERAERKSRILVAQHPLPRDESSFPRETVHPDLGLTIVAHGAAFAGSRVDIGTRVLWETLESEMSASPGSRILDLGCGTGALAALVAKKHPDARVLASDRSAAAVASARATMRRNGIADRVSVALDDAASEIAEASIDVVLLNPPFHLGTSIHTDAATKLFTAAARLLRPGGELWTVYNSSLAYRPLLGRLIGPTEQVRRTPKFTVTRSIRR